CSTRVRSHARPTHVAAPSRRPLRRLNPRQLTIPAAWSSPQERPPMAENVPATSQSWRRGFWSLIATQFQGAFNDYGLRNLVIFLILAHAFAQNSAGDPGVRDQLVFYVQA